MSMKEPEIEQILKELKESVSGIEATAIREADYFFWIDIEFKALVESETWKAYSQVRRYMKKQGMKLYKEYPTRMRFVPKGTIFSGLQVYKYIYN